MTKPTTRAANIAARAALLAAMTPLRLVLGTADLAEEGHAWRLFDRFYDAGGRALDVANVYGDGEAEAVVGSWLRTRRRDDVVVYVKGCHPPYCRRARVADEVEQARANLKRDAISDALVAGLACEHRRETSTSGRNWLRQSCHDPDLARATQRRLRSRGRLFTQHRSRHSGSAAMRCRTCV